MLCSLIKINPSLKKMTCKMPQGWQPSQFEKLCFFYVQIEATNGFDKGMGAKDQQKIWKNGWSKKTIYRWFKKDIISIRSIYIYIDLYSQFTTFWPKQFLSSTILQMMAHSSLPWAWTLYSSGYSSLNASKRASTSHKFDGETEMRVKNIHVPMTSSKRLLSHKNTSWHFPQKN